MVDVLEGLEVHRSNAEAHPIVVTISMQAVCSMHYPLTVLCAQCGYVALRRPHIVCHQRADHKTDFSGHNCW